MSYFTTLLYGTLDRSADPYYSTYTLEARKSAPFRGSGDGRTVSEGVAPRVKNVKMMTLIARDLIICRCETLSPYFLHNSSSSVSVLVRVYVG